LVQPTRRGTYFGWRGRALGYTAVTVASIAGLILYLMDRHDRSAGFTIIFALAFLCRLISWVFVEKVQELPLHFDKNDHFSFFKFIRRYKESNFVRFAVFVSAMNFSVNLAAPFFAVFMLRDLKFNYLLFTLINITAPLMLYSTILRWGKHADHVGNVKVLKVIAPFIGCIPLLWIINQNPIFLVCAEIISGFLWAGFNLCTSNFIMDAVIPTKRTRCLAYFSFMNGTALALGAITGGFLIRVLPPLFHYKILTLFLISAVLRVLVGLILPLPLKEVRHVTDISNQELLFSMIGVKPIAGIDR
jgi:MFS family permease